MTTPQVFEGLEGVLVARTQLSLVDGDRGRLSVRGHEIEALASRVPFEAVVELLLEGTLPPPPRLAALQAELGDARVRAPGW